MLLVYIGKIYMHDYFSVFLVYIGKIYMHDYSSVSDATFHRLFSD